MFFERCLRIFAALFGRKPRRVKRHMWLLMLTLCMVIHGLQIVPGPAVPFDRTTHQRSTFFYVSFEHPFRGEK